MRVLTAALAAATMTVGISGAAVAATPHADSTYKGATEEGNTDGTITIKVASATQLKLIKHVDSCGEVHKVKNVAVKADGTFKGQIKLEQMGGIVIWSVSGKFVKGGTKAKGSITQVACTGEKATFSALEK
jgi:hypothetical protein